MLKIIEKIIGSYSDRELKRIMPIVEKNRKFRGKNAGYE